MKIIKGLWYLCTKSHSYFLKDHWHYSPMDGYLNGTANTEALDLYERYEWSQN